MGTGSNSCTDKLFDTFIGVNPRLRRCFVGIFVVSLLVAIISLILAIWLGVSYQNCASQQSHQDTTQTTSQLTFPTLSPGRKIALDNFEIDTSTGLLEFTSKKDTSNNITGIFKDVLLNSADLVDCSKSSDKVCLESPSGYVITVESYDIGDGSVSCKKVRQSYPKYDPERNISTCINYGLQHWYGAAEVHDQHWPVQKWSIDLQEFVTRDPYYPGYFGSVQERYWLSSAGVGIHLPFDIPLFVSMNSSGDQQLCFISKFKDSVYNNVRQEEVRLELDICTAANLTLLHTAMADKFWDKPSDKPSLDALLKPIWSTWAEYKKGINETKLLTYAQRIFDENLPISQLEIDDDWTPHYGDWIINMEKFPNAKTVIESLKAKVNAVTIWIHPFINTDADAFIETADRGLLMLDEKKIPGLVKWWNPGYAGLLDFSNNQTVNWFVRKLENLKQNYSIDSFKFDAGEIVWLPDYTDLSVPYFHPSEYIKYYVETAVQSDTTQRRQEVRVGCLTQSAPLMVRMLDRRSRWGIDNGLRTVIPTALTFGLLGYPFVLPDMIGGNEYEDVTIDAELYIRWLQVNIFLPAIQFSIPPWRFNDPTLTDLTKSLLSQRESYKATFEKLANDAVQYGWPIVRPLWWIDASANGSSPSYWVDDQFLLGDDILVAPVLEQGAVKRDIYFPPGQWKDATNGEKVDGGIWLRDYPAELSKLPFFERQS